MVRGGSWWILILIWNKSDLFRASVNATRNGTRTNCGGERKREREREKKKKERNSSPLCPIGNDILEKETNERNNFVSREYETSVDGALQFPRTFIFNQFYLSADIPPRSQSKTFGESIVFVSRLVKKKKILVNNDWRGGVWWSVGVA